jgi:peptide/nickel transport system substrate-binding protein
VLAVGVGCGGSGETSKDLPRFKTRSFPVLRVEIDAGADSLDPGLSFTSESWQSLWNVYLSPLGYAHANGRTSTRIVPALAEKMPDISGGGLVYEFRVRKGVRYSNGKFVLASDFGYAIRRLYLLDSFGAPLFDDVLGAGVSAARRGPISGVRSNDLTRTVTIHLARPNPSFLDALASVFAAPVPQSTPSNDQTRHPIPSTGPYKISQVRWPKEFTLTRNRYFEATDTVPSTNPDRIVVSIVRGSRTAFERLVAGQADYAGAPIALASLERAEKKGMVQLRTSPGASTHYFFMNTTVRPFNDIRVRRAVNYAIDRRRLANVFGELAVPTENILPPLYPSYRKHDLYPYNIWRARALVRRAKAVGAPVTVYGLTSPASARIATLYLVQQLAAIGLKPSSAPTLLPPALYWSRIGSRLTRAQIGYAFWIQVYPSPFEWFESLLGTDQIHGLANTNYSFADIAPVNAEIERLAREPELNDDVNARWASLDRLAMQWAPLAPFLSERQVDAFGPLVDLRCTTVNALYGLDYGRVCLK